MNRIKYERNIVKRENQGKEPLDYDEWLDRAERARENSNRGYANEKSGREALQKQYPDKEVINSNSKDNVVILTDETGTNFRPDSVCYNEDGGYRIIHDNKDLSGKNPYLYDTPQLRAERNAARTDGGEHIITVTSNKSFVNGNPMVKISAPAAEYSTIYYVDKESKVITHIWQDGKWIKIK